MKLLVIRTSAMGDVALTIPVIKGMREQFPAAELIVLTREAYRPFFSGIEGIRLITADFRNRHKGLPGIFRLYREIAGSGKIDRVIDLHDVIRSKILRSLFRISGAAVSVIDKGRREKAAVISGRKKVQLKHSVERYCNAFARAGFPVSPAEDFRIIQSAEALARADKIILPGSILNIGVAPYAKHRLKMWPEEKMIRLLEIISAKHEAKFWLFGGKEEAVRMAELQKKVPGSFNLAGMLNLEEELALMSRLDLMIAMDSSNMHMAALAGTKVISIWGGTDPLVGFGAWKQPGDFSIRIPVGELTCRPCTIYGKGECLRGDFACMEWLTPEIVYLKIKKVI